MIEFDPLKDRINQEQHGVSLAAWFVWDGALLLPDPRSAYPDERTIAYGAIGNQLHCLVYTTRGESMRAISLRKANQSEVKYVRQYRLAHAQ